ncbi:MAG: DUF5615 family PIN-like protein [Planctomycetaceae bacterium]
MQRDRRVIRFHLDENVDQAVTRGLRERGIDATTTADAGLLGAPDNEHLDFVLREARVLMTHDPDFLRLHNRFPDILEWRTVPPAAVRWDRSSVTCAS